MPPSSPPALSSRLRRHFARLLHYTGHSVAIRTKGIEELPIRLRPFYLIATVLVLLILGVVFVHPTLGRSIGINDKVMHFVGMAVT